MLPKIALVIVSAQTFAAVPEVVLAILWNHDNRIGIATDVSTARAGKVDFEVVNESHSLVHEMLVVKAKSFHEALPYNGENASIYRG